MTLAIMRKDLVVLWTSAIPWVVGALFYVVLGLLYSGELDTRRQAVIQPLFPFAGFLLLAMVPLLTMRALAEEARTGTLELLQAVPVSAGAIVVGKWLAAWVTALVILLPTSTFVGLLVLYGEPDAGPIIAGFLGMALFAGTLAAIGILTSSLSSSQAVAAVIALFTTLILWFAHLGSETFNALPALAYFSLSERLRSFAGGGVDSADVGFFVVITLAALVLAATAVEGRRLR
jgi:ABC-2 type transport system permease protein